MGVHPCHRAKADDDVEMTIALFMFGTATVAIAFLPGNESIGSAAIWLLALARVARALRSAAHGAACPRCSP